MQVYSTNRQSPDVSIREAVLTGMPPDGGLYMPAKIPRLAGDSFTHLKNYSFQELAVRTGFPFFAEEVPETEFRELVEAAINFPAPLVPLEEDVSALELLHGPTLAFKDFGARFMARLMSFFIRQEDHALTILVATSGDTGSAVAHGFLRVPGIEVYILYPKNKVSEIQEKQFTTLGHNITALEIDGNFDDCQHLVKTAFTDPDLNNSLELTSANSINIARLIPQSFYYFWAYAQCDDGKPPVFSVPSGNFGNLTGGLLAKRMGLPIRQFIAASNVNDVVPAYLRTGHFTPRDSIETISNAMDVGNPSNFARMLDLYDHDVGKMRKDILGSSWTDDQTRQAIREVWERTGYLMDPHGAVGYLALREHLATAREDVAGIFLETAHPAKFLETVEPLIDTGIDIPDRLEEALHAEKQSLPLSNRFDDLKSFLLSTPHQ